MKTLKLKSRISNRAAVKICCGLILLLGLSGLVSAGLLKADRTASRREFKIQPLTFAGEKLTYEVKFSRFPIYATVGELTFELLGKAPEPLPGDLIADFSHEFKPSEGERFIHLRATAVAKGLLIRLFGVKAEDRFETLVDERDFSARLSFKRFQEGKKNLSQTTIFEPEKESSAYLVKDFSKPEEAPKESAAKITPGTFDLLSAIYYLRLPKLKTGESFSVPLNDEAQQYQIEVVVGKTEKLKTDLGKFKTIRVEPKIFGPGKLISREGEMTIWLTDDDRRIPVKATAKFSGGTATVNLIRMDGPERLQNKRK